MLIKKLASNQAWKIVLDDFAVGLNLLIVSMFTLVGAIVILNDLGGEPKFVFIASSAAILIFVSTISLALIQRYYGYAVVIKGTTETFKLRKRTIFFQLACGIVATVVANYFGIVFVS